MAGVRGTGGRRGQRGTGLDRDGPSWAIIIALAVTL